MKIGLLIPTTSNKREWGTIKDTYLFNLTLKTFLLTFDHEHEYVFYIGIDEGDKIFDNIEEQAYLNIFKIIYKNIDIKFIYMKCNKGYLTKMWNFLFQIAYDEQCDYFYQCGDDIKFSTKGWINDSITTLSSHHNIGISGPMNNNNKIMTQAFVSRVHMNIFGYFFPEEIINWGCDDWYNTIYKPNHFFPLNNHYCSNEGGKPRYIINNNDSFITNYLYNVTELRKKCVILGGSHKYLIDKYLNDRYLMIDI